MLKLTSKDAIDFSTELSEIQGKYKSLEAKYSDLLRSSEENARILLECERKRDELSKRIEQLEKVSDEALKEMLYDWIKLHGGTINIAEFAKLQRMSVSRVEEGLNMLITEGYIKRRFE
jgi:C-terminal processing protease CtpA/Prc